MKGKFIKTSDANTAQILRESGLLELAKEDDKWVFVNEKDKLNFEVNDYKECHTTDILHF